MSINGVGTDYYSGMFSYEKNYSNSVDEESGKKDSVSTINDSIEFSLAYSDDSIASAIDDIKKSLDSDNFYNEANKNGLTIEDYAANYGRILKSIKSNLNFSEEDVNNLTKILNNTYDDNAKKLSDKYAQNISSFFNKAYDDEANYKQNGVDLGSTAKKLMDKNALSSNINSMMSAAKAFYSNRPDGTKEELDQALNANFSKTESIEKLSYKDFDLVQKALNTSNVYASPGKLPDPESRTNVMNSALESLKANGASAILVDTFMKAKDQNSDCYQRENAYKDIKDSYEKQFTQLSDQITDFSARLKALEDQRKEVLKQNQEKLEKLEEELKKASLKLKMMNKDSIQKQLDDMKKEQDKGIKSLDDYRDELESGLNGCEKQYNELSKKYKAFQKDPTTEINNYIKENLDKEDKTDV